MLRVRWRLGLLVTLVLTIAAYASGFGNGFPYDDAYVAQSVREGKRNAMIAELRPMADYFATEYWQGAGSDRVKSAPLYRPITVWSFALTHAAWPGEGTATSEALPHRLLNLLLHLLNVVLVYLIACRLVGAKSVAPVLASAVFAFAAIHSEPVVSIVGRADLFAFAFGAAGLFGCMAAAQAEPPVWRRALGGVMASVALFLGLCSKESAITWWPLWICFGVVGGARWRGALTTLAIGLPAVAVWAWLRAGAFAELADPEGVAYLANPLAHGTVGHRVLGGLAVQGYALWSMLQPWPLVCDYSAESFPFAGRDGALGVQGYGLLAVSVLFLAVTFWAAWRRRGLLFLACATVAGMSSVTSNVFVPIGTIFGERLTYLPSFGVALAAVAWLARSPSTWAPRVVIAWCVVNGFLVVLRAPQWRDNNTLFLADVQHQPDSLFLRLNAAVAEQQRGNWQKWRAHLEAGLARQPEWARAKIELAAGRIVLARGREAKKTPGFEARMKAELLVAEKMLREASSARILEPDERKQLQENLGSVLAQLGRPDAAYAVYRELLAAYPDNVLTRHGVLVNAALGLKDAQFLAILREGARRKPDEPLWQMHGALRAVRLGRVDVAKRLLEMALPKIQLDDRCVRRAREVFADLQKQ